MKPLPWILAVTVFVAGSLPGCGSNESETGERARSLAGKRILMVLASNYFNDEEYRITRTVLENAGASLTVASSSIEVATGMSGTEVRPDILLNEVNASSYDAVVFVGGAGSVAYWDYEPAHEVARTVYAQGGVVGAICSAPVTLARAGLLKGKRATVSDSDEEQLRSAGAIYAKRGVVVDGTIITASGEDAARAFGKTVLDVMVRTKQMQETSR